MAAPARTGGAASTRAMRSARAADAWPTSVSVVGALLHELQIVVAEGPEERLGDLQGAGVVVGVQRLGRLATTPSRVGQHARVERVGDSGGLGHRERQHELRGVEHLDREAPADLDLRRVLRVERRVGAEAARRRPVPHRVRAVLREESAGVTTLPFDFDIFLRSGSTMKPEIAASDHGAGRPRGRCAAASRTARCG